MNPLAWKHEHQVALAIAFAIGCVLGLVVAFWVVDTYEGFRWGALWCTHRTYGCSYLLTGYRVSVAAWSIFGGLIAAAAVYVRQLLRV
ncbi:MAG: hypothetical protein ACREIW_03650 [Chthoniobacterales bacterium]